MPKNTFEPQITQVSRKKTQLEVVLLKPFLQNSNGLKTNSFTLEKTSTVLQETQMFTEHCSVNQSIS